jgi:hypothetical protein
MDLFRNNKLKHDISVMQVILVACSYLESQKATKRAIRKGTFLTYLNSCLFCCDSVIQ